MMDNNLLRSDEQAIFSLRSLYNRYGYERYQMGRFEEYDLYVRNKDFLVSDEIITFTDRSGRLMALKPDVTLSIIKNSQDAPGAVQKVYYNENVYRVAPGTHSFKEIMQAGLECIGDLKPYDVAEVVLLAVKSLALIARDYVLDISHMGLIAAILEDCGLSDGGKAKALVCLQQKNSHELAAVCKEENVPQAAEAKLLALAENGGKADPVLQAIEPLLTTEKEQESFRQLSWLCAILAENGFADHVQVDFSVGNDLKYYNGVVFKGYIQGVPTGVLSGGQYDRLLRKMGRKGKAVGFALYVDLLTRLEQTRPGYDVDNLLLCGDQPAAEIIAAAEKLRETGSVLTAAALPRQRTWRRLYRLEKGEAILVEDNG